MGAFVKSMVGIKQRDDDIHVQQGAHRSNSFLIHQILDAFKRHHFAARSQQRNAAARAERFFLLRGWSGQTTPRQSGNNFSRRAAFALRKFLGGLQHIVLNVQSRSHASDAIASPHQSQNNL
jgi:hypothetical protein